MNFGRCTTCNLLGGRRQQQHLGDLIEALVASEGVRVVPEGLPVEEAGAGLGAGAEAVEEEGAVAERQEAGVAAAALDTEAAAAGAARGREVRRWCYCSFLLAAEEPDAPADH